MSAQRNLHWLETFKEHYLSINIATDPRLDAFERILTILCHSNETDLGVALFQSLKPVQIFLLILRGVSGGLSKAIVTNRPTPGH